MLFTPPASQKKREGEEFSSRAGAFPAQDASFAGPLCSSHVRVTPEAGGAGSRPCWGPLDQGRGRLPGPRGGGAHLELGPPALPQRARGTYSSRGTKWSRWQRCKVARPGGCSVPAGWVPRGGDGDVVWAQLWRPIASREPPALGVRVCGAGEYVRARVQVLSLVSLRILQTKQALLYTPREGGKIRARSFSQINQQRSPVSLANCCF